MSGPSIIFGDKTLKKIIFFYRSRKLFNASDIDVNNILISKEVVYGTKNSFKYFIGYIDEDDWIRPQMIGCLKEFDDSMAMSLRVDDTMAMPLRVDDSKLFKKYCKIWRTISCLLWIEFDSEPVYGDTDSCTKTKLKMYDNWVNTNFQGKEVPKMDALYKCLSLIMLDSVAKVGKKYFPQVFLEECKYVKRKNKMMI